MNDDIVELHAEIAALQTEVAGLKVSLHRSRWRVFAAYVVIVVVAAAGLMSYRVQNRTIADSSRHASIDNCESDNETRAGVREIAYASGSRRLQDLARGLLDGRDCSLLPNP